METAWIVAAKRTAFTRAAKGALATLCVGGGMGAAMVLENARP
jgi:acetyl-CoA acetyltransferase